MQSFANPTQLRRGLALATFALVGAGLTGSAHAQDRIFVGRKNVTFTNLSAIPGIANLSTQSYPTAGCFSTDDCLSPAITLPFTFRYFGQNQTSVRVDSNGFFAFGSGAFFSDFTNDNVPSTNNPNNAIMPWWDDFEGIAVSHGTQGTAPNRIFIVELNFRPRFSTLDTRVQVWLYEGQPAPGFDNVFEVYYGGSINGGSATVGFEDSSGSEGVRVETCTPSCGTTAFNNLVNTAWRVGPPDDPELFPTFEANAFPRGAFPGTSATGQVEINNLGLAAGSTVAVDVWLSVDQTFDASTDFKIGTATVATVGALSSATATVTLNVPTGLASGDYNIFARVDPGNRFGELDEDDNVARSDQLFGTAYDLAGTDCRVTNPRGVNPGETLNFEIDLVNNGVPYVGSIDIQLRASTDASFDSGDPVLDTASVSFTGQNSETGSGSFTLRSGAVNPGQFFAICELDINNAVTEALETNNIVVGDTRFGVGPDFTISNVAVQTQVQPGGRADVTTTITNIAVPFTGSVEYQLYRSTNNDADVTMGDDNLGRFTVTFAGEDSINDTRSILFPNTLPRGRYFIKAIVDPRTNVLEVIEDNNRGVSVDQVVNAVDFVGLTATVDVRQVEAGDTMRVTGSASSTGLSFVGNVPVGVFFSADENFDGTDVEAFRGLIFFPGNTTGSIDVSFRAPSAVPPGIYNILVVPNPDNNPLEADRDNNAAIASQQVEVLGADLRAESLVCPQVVFIGRSMECTLEIRNESDDADARSFRYAYYLSDNDLIRVTDLQVFVSPTATIAAGGSQTFTDEIQIPSTFTSTRSLFVGVIVDIFSAVPELSETNNVRRIPNPLSVVFPIPDLVAQIVETATAAAAGEQLAVTRLLSNVGVADATSFDYTYYLSNNPTISVDDIAIGTFSSSLETNSDDYSIDILDLPPNLTPGTYYVGLLVDPENKVTEVDDTNNSAVGPIIPLFEAAIVFITESLPSGTIGVDYETGVYARGGPLPIRWTISSGTLPTGVLSTQEAQDQFRDQGLLTGTPTEEGVYNFTLRASSGTAFTERDFEVRVTSPTVQLEIATQLLRSAIAGRPYSSDIVAVGGVPPYRWTVLTGLPTGMTLTETADEAQMIPAGRLSGSPPTPGQFPVTVRVEDDLGSSATAQLELNVVSPGQSIQIQQVPLPNAIVSRPFCTDDNKVRFNAINGIEPYSWSVTGNLPGGMTFNEMGELCGTPDLAGQYDLTVRVQDATGLFDTSLFRLTVDGDDECAVATFTLPPAALNEEYEPVKLAQVSCQDPIEWSTVTGAGTLPPGMTLSTDGTLSGTPEEAGSFAFTAQITDATLSLDLQPLSIEVLAPPPPVMPEDNGCTCATPLERNVPMAWLVLLVPGLALFVRRRR